MLSKVHMTPDPSPAVACVRRVQYTCRQYACCHCICSAGRGDGVDTRAPIQTPRGGCLRRACVRVSRLLPPHRRARLQPLLEVRVDVHPHRVRLPVPVCFDLPIRRSDVRRRRRASRAQLVKAVPLYSLDACRLQPVLEPPSRRVDVQSLSRRRCEQR